MRTQIATLAFACLLAVTGAMAQNLNTPAPGRRAAPPAPDGTLGMALMGAFVDSDGTLIRGAGATSVTFISTGQFVVEFNRDVSTCFYSAVAFDTAAVFVVHPNGTILNSLAVQLVYGDTHEPVPTSFYLTVFCAR